ncbi:MAG: type II secretion system major pseudopilin GspG [Phycisphaerae bacterium]|nr:type II secretion system major pseudopilin GspG [Phycisphaerae bacterium]
MSIRAVLRMKRVRSRRTPLPSQPAFTLVELMVVIVLLGLLATVVTVAVNDYLVTGKQAVARSEIAQISNALQLFYTESSRYPSNEEGLASLKAKTAAHPNGILQGDLLDPWGHEYVYVYPGLHGTFDLISYGANGQEGGEGADRDITNWDADDAAGG